MSRRALLACLTRELSYQLYLAILAEVLRIDEQFVIAELVVASAEVAEASAGNTNEQHVLAEFVTYRDFEPTTTQYGVLKALAFW